MPDSSAVDAAVVAKLSTDATLMSTLTDGVFFDIAPHGKTKFVIVSQLAHEDEYTMGGAVWERFLYLVKAVTFAVAGDDIKTAAARIQTLLQDGSITATGYGLMSLKRVERLRYTEVDPEQPDARWQHRGGHYEVLVQPA